MTEKLITEMTLPECQRLLEQHHFGRLAFIDQVEARPMILPVNYLLHQGKVVFRTDPGAKLAPALTGAPVAFEVDGIQAHDRVGWSVVVLGHLQEVTDRAEIDLLSQTPLIPWAPGPKQHYVRVDPDRLSGRRISVADLPSHWWG
jgi:nitroimidazol reductase NimA-like FMN-containing flavoprotein (pyridoxamine 5'-phosphate oxidase superfamily)